jgi:hypothetical protein
VTLRTSLVASTTAVVSEKFAWQISTVFAPFVMWNPLIVAPGRADGRERHLRVRRLPAEVVLYSDWAPHVAVASACRA